MWNKDKSPEHPNVADTTSFFGKGLRLVGSIDSENDIRIDGMVEGNIKTDKRVIIGTAGSVIGNINATNIQLMGEVLGDLCISGLADIGVTAKIKGTVTTDKLHIEPGALIEAEIKRFSASSHGKSNNKSITKGLKNPENKSEDFFIS